MRALVAEGALTIETPSEILPLLRRSWLPPGTEVHRDTRGVIRMCRGSTPPRIPTTPATLRLGPAHLWIHPERPATLSGTGGCWGTVDLEQVHAELFLADGADADPGSDAYSMLTIAAALLLGRTGSALMHSAAVVSPDGTAWLLTGDSHSGKSTTTVNLITQGWNYLSDDQVVLSAADDPDAVAVTGWLRPFHLDEGWTGGTPAHRRGSVDASVLGPGRPVGRAPLGVLLFPAVSPESPTAALPLAPVDAIAGLVRQSPWLLADRGSASDVLQLLKTMALKPAYRLSLGLDCFRDGAVLAKVLLGLLAESARR